MASLLVGASVLPAKGIEGVVRVGEEGTILQAFQRIVVVVLQKHTQRGREVCEIPSCSLEAMSCGYIGGCCQKVDDE